MGENESLPKTKHLPEARKYEALIELNGGKKLSDVAGMSNLFS